MRLLVADTDVVVDADGLQDGEPADAVVLPDDDAVPLPVDVLVRESELEALRDTVTSSVGELVSVQLLL